MFLKKEHFKTLLSRVLDHFYEGEDDSVYGVISAGGDMTHDLIVTFFYEPERVLFSAASPSLQFDIERESDILFFINKWNSSYINQCACYDSELKSVFLSGAIFTDVELSDDYLIENFLKFYLSAAIHFFTEACKAFPGKKKQD